MSGELVTQERPRIYEALAKVMSGIGVIGKDSTNVQQGFKFRGIDDVYNHIHHLMADNEIVCLPCVLDLKREQKPSKTGGIITSSIVTVKYTFATTDSSFVEVTMTGEGMDSGDKSTSKALAIADKYCLLQMFKVPTRETKDPDADTVEPVFAKTRQVKVNTPPFPQPEPVIDATTPPRTAEQVIADGDQPKTDKEVDAMADYMLGDPNAFSGNIPSSEPPPEPKPGNEIKIGFVESGEPKKTKAGKDYWTVRLKDGFVANCFSDSAIKVLKIAKSENKAVSLEIKTSGKFSNIESATLVEG